MKKEVAKQLVKFFDKKMKQLEGTENKLEPVPDNILKMIDNSKKYRMLCLEHVKEFNKNWNYFSGMNDKQIMDFLKSDMIWHKPTQSFSSSDNFFKILWNNALKDEKRKFYYGDLF